MKQATSRPSAVFGCLAFGVLVGVVGTIAHRYRLGDHRIPVGIVAALILVLVAAVMCRAWAGYVGLGSYGLGWVLIVQLMSMKGPGGDLLVASQIIGYIWIYGGLALVGCAAFLPRSWFSDRPLARSGRRKHQQLQGIQGEIETIGRTGPQG